MSKIELNAIECCMLQSGLDLIIKQLERNIQLGIENKSQFVNLDNSWLEEAKILQEKLINTNKNNF